MKEIIESGMSPEEVAEKVLAAVQSGQLYVLTHDDESWLNRIRERTENIIERRNPVPEPLA